MEVWSASLTISVSSKVGWGGGKGQGDVPSTLGLMPVTQVHPQGSSHCQSRNDGAHNSKTGVGLMSYLPFKIFIVGLHVTT